MLAATASGGLPSTYMRVAFGFQPLTQERGRACHVAHTVYMYPSASFHRSAEFEVYSMVLHQLGVVAISTQTESRSRAGYKLTSTSC